MNDQKNPNAPCPTCKRAPHVAHIRYTDDVQAWQVHCPRCRMSGPLKPTKVEAVNAWNSMSLAAQLMEAAEHKIQCEDAHHMVWHSGPVNGAAGNESAAALRDAITHIDMLMFEVARHVRRQERDQEKEGEDPDA